MFDTDVKVIDEILSEKHKELAPDLDGGEFFEFFAPTNSKKLRIKSHRHSKRNGWG